MLDELNGLVDHVVPADRLAQAVEAELITTVDAEEGRRAFLEKRPAWRDR